MASGQFRYKHPSRVSDEEVARLRGLSRVLVSSHDELKWGGAILFWLGLLGLAFLDDAGRPFDLMIYVVTAIGGLSFGLSLIWRMFTVTKR